MGRKKKTPIPQLAYHDMKFVESPAARPLRILGEYLEPLVRLRQNQIGDTIVIFGSARVFPREEARKMLLRAKKQYQRKHTKEARTKLVEACGALTMSRYYEEARELARRLTAWAASFGDHPRRFVICSGGGPGIMMAANQGAADAGGVSIGLNIQLPHEQEPNKYITPGLSFDFHYFFMRKLWFAQLASALVVFPGGFGTMDELWEIMTLQQTGKVSARRTILIYGREYWAKVLNFEHMMREGTISKDDYELLQFADTVDEAFECIARSLEKQSMKLDTDWSGFQ